MFLLVAIGVPSSESVSADTPNADAISSELFHVVRSTFGPKPKMPQLDPRKVEIGRRLFHDPILSGEKSVSCATCHDIAAGGGDGRPRSIGASGRPTRRNAPSVLNAALHFAQFWDGRAVTLEEQLDSPIHHPDEMASNWDTVLARVGGSKTYKKLFREAYKDVVSVAHIKDAIASFERSLIGLDSRFDRFLAGDGGAITDEEIQGLLSFVELGCASCHQGPLFGGNLYQRFGVFGEVPAGEGGTIDYGRYEVTGEQGDRFVFKVPSLRNVELTAPYFHNGSVDTLERAIDVAVNVQLGRPVAPKIRARIAAFLKTLTSVPTVTVVPQQARSPRGGRVK